MNCKIPFTKDIDFEKKEDLSKSSGKIIADEWEER